MDQLAGGSLYMHASKLSLNVWAAGYQCQVSAPSKYAVLADIGLTRQGCL